MMRRDWSDRERNWVVAGGVVAFLLLLTAFVVMPYLQGLAKLNSRREKAAGLIAELQEIQPEVARLRAAQGRQPRSATSDTLTALMEGSASRLGLRERLVSLRPQSLTEGSPISESLEVVVERVSLEELVRWLYAIDKAPGGQQVSQLRLRKRFDNQEQFDATLLLVRQRSGGL